MRVESSPSSVGRGVVAAMTVSAVGALVSMYVIGHRQRSMLLIAMFVLWALSPYVGLYVLIRRSRASAHSTMEVAALFIALLALVRYAWVVVWPVKAQPASTFMIVPFASWIAIGVALAVAARASRST